MQFKEDKTKSILFKTNVIKSKLPLTITRNENVINQHSAWSYKPVDTFFVRKIAKHKFLLLNNI